MGIKARSAGHTTSPPHNITPSSAGDTIPASTITDLQDNIHNLPGMNTIRPSQSQPRQLTLGLKNSQFPSNTKQHFTMP
jgi:hypothetical protein